VQVLLVRVALLATLGGCERLPFRLLLRRMVRVVAHATLAPLALVRGQLSLGLWSFRAHIISCYETASNQ
jgi:hypothetical protein